MGIPGENDAIVEAAILIFCGPNTIDRQYLSNWFIVLFYSSDIMREHVHLSGTCQDARLKEAFLFFLWELLEGTLLPSHPIFLCKATIRQFSEVLPELLLIPSSLTFHLFQAHMLIEGPVQVVTLHL